MSYILGIDTSCYTTSVAIMDEKGGSLVGDYRKPLVVKPGGRGLAQSEMVFQHLKNLPEVFQSAVSFLSTPVSFSAITVSAFPRPLPDSCMPAFKVGESFASVLASVDGVPLFRISHQENHILAGLWSANGPKSEEFLAVHVSGGTTEIVSVTIRDKSIAITMLGCSRDLHAGQFVDRVGVALGLQFPAGPHLEILSASSDGKPAVIPVSVKGMTPSFSGPETHAIRLAGHGENPAAIAAGVEFCIGETVSRMIMAAVESTGLQEVLLVGGVMSNRAIRQHLFNRLTLDLKIRLFFPEAQYSPDSAVGAAYFGRSS